MRPLPRLCLCLFVAFAAPAALLAQTPTFSSHQISTGAGIDDIASIYLTGNFNGNGNTDLVIANYNPNTFRTSYEFLTGDGTGNFSDTKTLLDIGTSALVADVDGDGKDDIITLTGGCEGQTPCTSPSGSGFLSVLLSQGNGQFIQGYRAAATLLHGIEGVVGDFNKDGKPDIAVLTYGTGASFYRSAGLDIFTNQGNDSFGITVYRLPEALDTGTMPTNLVTGDFEGNGNQDLAFAFTSSTVHLPELYTFAGNGKGGFGAAEVSYSFDSSFIASNQDQLYAADLNRDGRTDLLIDLSAKGSAGNARVPSLLAKVSGNFYWSSAVYPDAQQFPNIALGDFNGDGKPGLVYVGGTTSTSLTPVPAGIYLGLGTGAFKTPHIPLSIKGIAQTPTLTVAPLKKGALPSLFVSYDQPTVLLFVNTTK